MKIATNAAGEMMMYLDTAILIKLLVPEPDSALFNERVTGESLSSSELAWTEVSSALLAKERNKQITPGERETAWKAFVHWVDSEQIQLHPLSSTALKKAGHVLQSCHPQVPLRTLDAIHVAACDLSQDFPLCTTDGRMRSAAEVLNIPVFPKSSP